MSISDIGQTCTEAAENPNDLIKTINISSETLTVHQVIKRASASLEHILYFKLLNNIE